MKKLRAFVSAALVLTAAAIFAGCSGFDVEVSDVDSQSLAQRAAASYDTSLSGNYYIKNAYSGLYLDVDGGATANGTNIQQWTYNGYASQQFSLVSVGNGYYAIKTVCSGGKQALDVWARGTADGTNIATYEYGGGINQHFKFVKQSDGSYAILTRMSGDKSCLDDYEWSKSAGGNVVQWNYWGGACQKWFLTKVGGSSSQSYDSGFMRGVDVSALYSIEEDGTKYYEKGSNSSKDMLQILKDHGVNWIRLRVWNDPSYANYVPMTNYGWSDIWKAVAISKRAKALGMKVLLDLHYSDTWADPGYQLRPKAWDNCSGINDLASRAAAFTTDCLSNMQNYGGGLPDMIQIGNEINSGIMISSSWYTGTDLWCGISTSNFQTVMKACISAVRSYNRNISIMLHLANGGYANAISNAYRYIGNLDFDVLGLSYYPYFESNKTANDLASVIKTYKAKGKRVVVAETSFPWTVDQYANDNVSNTIWYYNDARNTGLSSAYNNLSCIAGSYGIATGKYNGTKIVAASEANQKAVVSALFKIVKASGGDGLFYWGGEWVASNSFGSTWENQALFDLNHRGLSVLDAFRDQY